MLYLADFVESMRKVLVVFIFLSSTFLAAASDSSKPRFVYDVDLEMNFDNREYYKSRFSSSMTIFGARLTPSVGLALKDNHDASHRLMLGVDVMKDFGASPVSELIAGGQTEETSLKQNNLGLFREIVMYYKLEKQFGKTKMDLYAGIFPRLSMEGSYSQAFFSDSLKFYDNNLEGLLLKFRRPVAHFELGCDWMGQYGVARREKFMIFTAGEGKVLPFMSLGYAGYMLHYANSRMAQGLVDNILVNPYMRFDFGEMTRMQELSLRLGWLQAMQRDREYAGVFVFPCGVEFDQEIRKWNVGISNRMFFGHDMMPYYNNFDNVGLKYGTSVYFGDPFYRIHDRGGSGPGLYDRLEVYYEPVISRYLSLRVSALFHFHNTGYSGCQQVVSLRFESLLKR